MTNSNYENTSLEPIIRPVESDPIKVALENASDEIRSLVKDESRGYSGISGKTTTLPDGSSIALNYRPDRDIISVGEIKGPRESRKVRDRKWSNQDPSNPLLQERHVLRRDNRGIMEVKKNGFRERDVKRIGRLITKFKENEGRIRLALNSNGDNG